MKHHTFTRSVLIAGLILGGATGLAQAQDNESGALQACLKAWGEHPFGPNPAYRTLATSVKVFGIGQGTADREVTPGPSLIMVNPGARLASASSGTTVMSGENAAKGVSVMGSIKVERVGCTSS